MIWRVLKLTISLSTAALVACQPESSQSQSTDIVTKIERFCGQGSPGKLEIEVWFATCLSSSCDTLKFAECTLQESNGVVTIEGTAEINRQTDGPCTNDCQKAMTQCSLERPPGIYRIEHAGQSIELELPTHEDVCSEIWIH